MIQKPIYECEDGSEYVLEECVSRNRAFFRECSEGLLDSQCVEAYSVNGVWWIENLYFNSRKPDSKRDLALTLTERIFEDEGW